MTEHEAAEHEAGPSGTDIDDAARVRRIHEARAQLSAEIRKVIVGQERVVELLLTALFAGGHCLLVGVPGLAKTLLVSTLARVLSLSFRRVQFTPDLMPSEITGTEVIQEDPKTGERSFRFLRGPVFANLLLADEINRTPPKTQAALLEAMQERHVTVGDRTYPLPDPFLVLATQNPIEHEGTYPLPEAQLDRFMLAIEVRYPSESEELEIMKRGGGAGGVKLEPVLTAEDIRALQPVVPRLPAGDHVYQFALKLVRLSRPEDPAAPQFIKDCLSWGAGPRAADRLMLAAKARAVLHGRFHTTIEDVAAVAGPVLAHRLVLNFNAAAEGLRAATIVERLLTAVPRDGAA